MSGWFPKSYANIIDGIGGKWYINVYPFAAPEEGDLKFEVGERIRVLEDDSEWWVGEIDDRRGIFPANYVIAED